MSAFEYTYQPSTQKRLGLIVLREDERIEKDFQTLCGQKIDLFISRIASAPNVTLDSLAAMEEHLATSASLLPNNKGFDAIGYGCTSGSAQIGAKSIDRRIRSAIEAKFTTNPLQALVTACQNQNVKSLALLSPYIETVSDKMRNVLRESDIATPLFGSFNEEREAQVIGISPQSTLDAAMALVNGGTGGIVDGLFLSCTNLNTLGIIKPLQRALNIPVFSSNLVLAWDMLRGADFDDLPSTPSELLSGE